MTDTKHLHGDCREVLKTLPEKSLHCCVTSPPYFGLRDYGTATWEGGDDDCDHQTARSRGDDIKSGDKQGTSKGSRPNTHHVCSSCGAVRIDSQLGLEETPEEYVANMVQVFREVKRVLRDDGTLWLNLGDSYNGSGGNHKPEHKNDSGFQGKVGPRCGGGGSQIKSLKPKDLVGIPWRVAFALQADGWYLRQDIIWHKPNPMPESVEDRCTKSHEYIFLLSKKPKYYFDNEAIKEPAKYAGDDRGSRMDNRRGTECNSMSGVTGDHRNKRSVWTVTTKPFKGAHFAVFPPDLIRPCILAGCPEGGTVLDPFGGSGTTAMVAEQEGRSAILIELNEEYIALQKDRTAQTTIFSL